MQPSLILLPAMVMLFARHRTQMATAGIVITALALAIQPDRAMAGALVAGLAALVGLLTDPGRRNTHAAFGAV